jgi:DNA-binding NarL/FixJ family response regulator
VTDGVAQRVLVVDPQDFSRLACVEFLERSGYDVSSMATLEAAEEYLPDFAPDAVIVQFEMSADPATTAFLKRLCLERPDTGIVALARHRAAGKMLDRGGLPPSSVRLIRSEMSSMSDIADAVERAIERARASLRPDDDGHRITLTQQQAEILSLIAEGYSNAGIAKVKGVSVRSAEAMVHRSIAALGIEADHRHNARVLAARLWHQGRVNVE